MIRPIRECHSFAWYSSKLIVLFREISSFSSIHVILTDSHAQNKIFKASDLFKLLLVNGLLKAKSKVNLQSQQIIHDKTISIQLSI